MVWLDQDGLAHPRAAAITCSLFRQTETSLLAPPTKLTRLVSYEAGSSVGVLHLKGWNGLRGWTCWWKPKHWSPDSLWNNFTSSFQLCLLCSLKALIFTLAIWRVREHPSFPWICFTSVQILVASQFGSRYWILVILDCDLIIALEGYF